MEGVRPQVQLLGYTQLPDGGGAEMLVAAAAKLCYSKVGATEIMERMTEQDAASFIQMLLSLGHDSPLEHANFTFLVEGISRVCSHQLVRHRHGSYSQQSQRYVDLADTFKVIYPPEIVSCEKARIRYEKSILEDFNAYQEITKILEESYITETMGPKEKSAMKKKALEDARYALPNACETKIMVTMNARSLMNFFHLRCCNRAQWEIQEVANQMLDLVLEIAPNLFQKAGAPCTYGNCPEGSKTCGKKQLPREKQKRLEMRKNYEG